MYIYIQEKMIKMAQEDRQRKNTKRKRMKVNAEYGVNVIRISLFKVKDPIK